MEKELRKLNYIIEREKISMNEFDYNKFKKRYNKFKKNNLPTPFWDEERQTYEYVYYSNEKSYNNDKKIENQLNISNSLTKSLGEIAFAGFYYSYTTKYIVTKIENQKVITEVAYGHSHAHSFEDVVKALYDAPESFNISKDEEQFYSKQELNYLRRVQKYLLFIGMKDLETEKIPVNRYINKNHSKYENAYIYRFNDDALGNIYNGRRNFKVIDWYIEYPGDKKYKPKEYQALIVDKNEDFKFFVEFTTRKVKKYKDIKDVYKRDDLNDNDKIIVDYFKILKIF